MARIPRAQLQTYTYFHVCARGNNGRPVFLDDQDRFRYLGAVERYRNKYGLECFAYCLMTNHIHLLLLAPTVRKLSKMMHALQVSYVVYFNKRYQRRGHLFEARYTSWVIRNECHALEAKKYIEENPLKANMVKADEPYPWSSATGDRSPISLSKLRG